MLVKESISEIHSTVGGSMEDFWCLVNTVKTVDSCRNMSINDMEAHLIAKIQNTYERVQAEFTFWR